MPEADIRKPTLLSAWNDEASRVADRAILLWRRWKTHPGDTGWNARAFSNRDCQTVAFARYPDVINATVTPARDNHAAATGPCTVTPVLLLADAASGRTGLCKGRLSGHCRHAEQRDHSATGRFIDVHYRRHGVILHPLRQPSPAVIIASRII